MYNGCSAWEENLSKILYYSNRIIMTFPFVKINTVFTDNIHNSTYSEAIYLEGYMDKVLAVCLKFNIVFHMITVHCIYQNLWSL